MICSNCFLTPCSCEAGGILPAGITGQPITTHQAVLTTPEGRVARHAVAVTFTPSQTRPIMDESTWVTRFLAHIDQIPTILVAIREDTVPLRATTYDADKVQASKGDAPAPVNLIAVDDADDLWARLVPYARECSELLHATPPASLDLVWMHHGQVAGLPAGLEPRAINTAAYAVIEWLAGWVESIEWMVPREGVEDLFRSVRALAGKWTPDGVVRRATRRVCLWCGEKRVDVRYEATTDGPDALVVMCQACGATYETPPTGAGGVS